MSKTKLKCIEGTLFVKIEDVSMVPKGANNYNQAQKNFETLRKLAIEKGYTIITSTQL